MESVKEMRDRLQKNQLGHPILQRVLSIYITRALIPTRATATYVTVAMFVLALLGSLLIALGWVWTGLLIVYLALVLDATDGELARYRKISSLRSIYMDLVNHLATQAFFFLALAFWVASGLAEPWHTAVLVAGALAAVAFSVRRANGDLHRGMYVRPFTDPGLYTLDYVHIPVVEVQKTDEEMQKINLNPIHLVKKGIYEMHELGYMLIIISVVLFVQQKFIGSVYGLSPMGGLVFVYAATSCAYLVREIVGGFFAIDRRVHEIKDRIEKIRAKTGRYE